MYSQITFINMIFREIIAWNQSLRKKSNCMESLLVDKGAKKGNWYNNIVTLKKFGFIKIKVPDLASEI